MFRFVADSSPVRLGRQFHRIQLLSYGLSSIFRVARFPVYRLAKDAQSSPEGGVTHRLIATRDAGLSLRVPAPHR
ncbi:MAG: hypothetical protein M1571_09750 [Firmicutes bacterium]|nr:hypothetical protein [Bacillota bacterium]